MTQFHIRLILALGVIAMVGIIPIQAYWVKRAFDLRERQFDQNVQIALKNVAVKVREFNNTSAPLISPVSQYASNYFVVNVQDLIDINVLEYYLKSEFEKSDLTINYEYGIYDCRNNSMVYGNLINGNNEHAEYLKLNPPPSLKDDAYYFTIYFPSKTIELTAQMHIWIFSSVVFLLVVVFFAYTLWIVLRQKRLSEIQSDFINNMTHEFKTPLATISISSDVLKNPEIINSPHRLQKYATIINEEALRLKNHVERVLQIANNEIDSTKIKKENVDFHEIIYKTLQMLEPKIGEKNGQVELNLEAIKSEIVGDPLHLSNIIYNLVDNALKYTNSDPNIIISTKSTSKHLVVSVADNGLGINAQAQKKVFYKFYRVPTGNIHDVKGFGIGLYYVQTMIKAHKGNIELSSKEGAGSVFTFKLPLFTD